MNHHEIKRESSRVKRLLLAEEFRSERVICILRTAVLAFFTGLVGVDAILQQRSLLTTALPFAVVLTIAVVLLVHNLAIGTNVRKTGRYGEPAKYFHIVADVAMIAFLSHLALTVLERMQPSIDPRFAFVLYTVFFIISATSYLFINLFRFHPYASLFTGVLLLTAYFVIAFTIPLFAPIVHEVGSLKDHLPSLLIFESLFVIDIILSVLIALRVRRLLVKNAVQAQLARFLPETVTRQVLEQGIDLPAKGEKRKVTILFADIRGFSSLAESLAPEEVVDFLNTYYNDMIEIIFRYNGMIDKLIGDGLMALFGVPIPSNLSAGNAVRAAVDMCRKLESLNELRKFHKQAPIKIGIGIHTGTVVLGSIGTERRMDFTAIGDAVNTASRLEKLTKKVPARIIISETSWVQLGREFAVTPLGKVTLPGKKQALRLFSVNPWSSRPGSPVTEA